MALLYSYIQLFMTKIYFYSDLLGLLINYSELQVAV